MARARRRQNPAAEALDAPRLTLDDLADATGATRAALERYRLTGPRAIRMPAPVRLRLAAFLEGHARRLLELAGQLREERD